jgi:hypothetical protein
MEMTTSPFAPATTSDLLFVVAWLAYFSSALVSRIDRAFGPGVSKRDFRIRSAIKPTQAC